MVLRNTITLYTVQIVFYHCAYIVIVSLVSTPHPASVTIDLCNSSKNSMVWEQDVDHSVLLTTTASDVSIDMRVKPIYRVLDGGL